MYKKKYNDTKQNYFSIMRGGNKPVNKPTIHIYGFEYCSFYINASNHAKTLSNYDYKFEPVDKHNIQLKYAEIDYIPDNNQYTSPLVYIKENDEIIFKGNFEKFIKTYNR